MNKLKAGIFDGPQIKELMNVWRITEESWTICMTVTYSDGGIIIIIIIIIGFLV